MLSVHPLIASAYLFIQTYFVGCHLNCLHKLTGNSSAYPQKIKAVYVMDTHLKLGQFK